MGLTGTVIVQRFDKLGQLTHEEIIHNLVTDAGDLYYASMGIALVGTPNTAQPTKANGMKLGIGTTAVSKASTGAALVSYTPGSNLGFDAAYPQVANLGTTLGVNAVYRTTWAAGVATAAALTEATICTDQATNGAGTAATTISRVVFSAINKTATDVLVITWNHKLLGA
jgi:hypothetical protein